MTTERIQRGGAYGLLGAINMIAVIESLRESDWKTGRLIREDLEVVALPYENNLQVHYKTARNADELEFLLRELEAMADILRPNVATTSPFPLPTYLDQASQSPPIRYLH